MKKEEIIKKYEEKISFTDKCVENMTIHRNEIGRMMRERDKEIFLEVLEDLKKLDLSDVIVSEA